MNAEEKENKIIIYDCFEHKETIKQIPGRFWDPEPKTWTIPCTLDNLTTLKIIGCTFDTNLEEKIKGAESRIEASTGLIIPIEPMPIRVIPYTHQIEGYNRVCEALGIFSGGSL